MAAEYQVTRRPRRCPTHPGVILRDEVLPALGLSVSEAARQLRVTRQTLHRIMTGSSAVTAEMAVRLGKFCGNGPGLWLRMQQSYDLWRAEQELHDEVKQIPAYTVR
jgi:addiction module HigA family antidote